jgi:hypothetical protein
MAINIPELECRITTRYKLGTKGTFSWHLLSDPWGSDWVPL